ncbi:MAG: hypothetical protein WBG73_21230 [Coleofasciculaceae cyanobacterium]
MLVNFPKINYRYGTACLILLTALTVSSCAKKVDDIASNAPGDSTAQTDTAGTTAQDPTTTGAKKAKANTKLSAEAKKLGVTPTGTTCPTTAPIKGNINKKGNKIYHEAKAKGFDKIKPEICFADTATAQKAGFVATAAKATKTP